MLVRMRLGVTNPELRAGESYDLPSEQARRLIADGLAVQVSEMGVEVDGATDASGAITGLVRPDGGVQAIGESLAGTSQGWTGLTDVLRNTLARQQIVPVGRESEWAIVNAANTTVTEVATDAPVLGTHALRLTAAAVAGQNASATKNVEFNLNNSPGMWVVLNNRFRQANGIGLTLFTSQDQNLIPGNRFQAQTWASTLISGRTPIWVPKSRFTVVDGAPSWQNNMRSFRVRMDSSGTLARDVDFEGAFTGGQRPAVLISFDDGWGTSFTVGHAEARRRGIPLAHFLIHNLLGFAGYITLAQAQQMRDAGDYLGLHGELRWDQNPARIASDVAGLRALGIDTRHAATPEGQLGDGLSWLTTKAALQAAGVLSNRLTATVAPLFASPVLRGVNDPYTMPGYPLNNQITLAQARAAVDLAIESGGTCIFYAHKIDAVADSLTWVTSDYIALLDYIQQRRAEGQIDTPRYDLWFDDRVGRNPAPAPARFTRGTATNTGNGSATTFSWAHGLPAAPNVLSVQPSSAAAAAQHFATADATSITVTYATAPANAAALSWRWVAEM